jgi:hypothetical protein
MSHSVSPRSLKKLESTAPMVAAGTAESRSSQASRPSSIGLSPPMGSVEPSGTGGTEVSTAPTRAGVRRARRTRRPPRARRTRSFRK